MSRRRLLNYFGKTETYPLLDEIKAGLQKLPDCFMTTGHASCPAVWTYQREIDLDSKKGVHYLQKHCVQAPCGRGTETVVDLSVRKTLETADVTVDWPDLDRVLQTCASRLCPHLKLQARFYKLLLYQKGDFFYRHVDSKRDDNHLLTLVVNCSSAPCNGGQVCFGEYEHQRSSREEVRWASTSAGDWCCWLTSEPHRVEEISQGHRVVATFDVFAYPGQQVNSLEESSLTIEESTNKWVKILALTERVNASMDSMSQTTRTCRALCRSIGSTTDMFTQLLNHPQLSIELKRFGSVELGFLLRHKYSFPENEAFPSHHLIGRDSLLFRALQTLQEGEPRVVDCTVCCELVDDANWRSTPTRQLSQASRRGLFRRGRIARGINDVPESEWDYYSAEDVIPVEHEFQEFAGGPTLTGEEANFLWKTANELDPTGRPIWKVWPFRGVCWICEQDDLMKHFVAEQSMEDLWGNAAQFGLYAYRHAALLCKIRHPGVQETSLFAQDIF